MKKSARAILTDLIDQKLIETDGEFSIDEAMDFAMDEDLGLAEAFVTLLWHQRSARYHGVAPAQFLREYVEAKFVRFAEGDKGARGDAVEAVARYHLKKRFIHYNDVMTSDLKRKDVTSKRFGAIEVGHNGKTFQKAYVPASQDKATFTERNYMNGDFEVVVYGAFQKDFTAEDLLNDEKFLRIMKVFTNKYEFPQAIAGRHGLASGWNVAHERATVQYNDALRIRFKEYCKVHHVLTLGQYINGEG